MELMELLVRAQWHLHLAKESLFSTLNICTNWLVKSVDALGKSCSKNWEQESLNLFWWPFHLITLVINCWYLQTSPKSHHYPPIYLHWDFRNFWHSPVWNIQFDFFPSLNWEKIPVWNIKLAKSKIPVRVVKMSFQSEQRWNFPSFHFFDSQQCV